MLSLSPTAPKKQIDSLTNYISSIPYANRVEYVTQEMAVKRNSQENEHLEKIIDANPLPESIDFYIKADYVEKDSLNNLATLSANHLSRGDIRISISYRNGKLK